MSNTTDQSTIDNASPMARTGLRTMEFARNFTTQLLDATPDEHFLTRTCAKGNHAAWIVGHLAVCDDLFIAELASQPRKLPADWHEKFGMKCELSDDPAAYPSRRELTDAMNDRRRALVTYLASLTDEQLLEPIEGDLAGFAPTRAGLMNVTAWHEGIHAGQLSAARRAAGLDYLM